MFGEEDEEDNEEQSSPSNNPYLTTESPHPLLELSFNLGMRGLGDLLVELDRDREPLRR